MKSISLVLMMSFSFSALAADVQPAVGGKVCVGRRYLKDHLSAHPKQKLNALAVIVENFPADKNWDEPHVTAKVVGEHDGKLWANESGCEYKKDGSLKCQIECDGGAFTLTPNQSSADFKVQKDYYFPLFKKGTNFENPAEEDVLNLDYTDPENRIYRLFEADTQSCVEMWQMYEAVDHGC